MSLKIEHLAGRMMHLAPVDFERFVDKLDDETRSELTRHLDGIALNAVERGAYLWPRCACGSDNGHEDGVKHMAKNGKALWVGLLTYGAYHPISF